MTDRMNTVEGQLSTDLNACSDITDEIKKIEIGVLETGEKPKRYLDHETPALVFECLECESIDPIVDSNELTWERLHFVCLIINRGAQFDETRRKIKELISLVRDFLFSTDWTYAENTNLGRSGFEVGRSENAFTVAAGIEFTVDVQV